MRLPILFAYLPRLTPCTWRVPRFGVSAVFLEFAFSWNQ